MSSKTCHSCRRSRLRCDGGQPTCLKCNSRGVECLGYGSRPLLWVQPTSSVVSTSVYSHAARKKGRPKLVLMQQSKNRVEERSVGKFVEHIRVQSSVSALSPLLPAGYTVACSTLDVLMYYNKNVCSDMVALHSPTNPHSIDLELWPILPDLVVDFFSAVVATHRVIRSQSYGSLSTESPNAVISTGITDRYLDKLTHPLVKNIYKHHQQVIKVLGMLLDDEEIRFSDEIFGIISGLMLFEIQQSAHSSWSVHLEAMRMIVSQRGGFEQLAKEYSLARYMFHLQMFMLVDIMSCVTAASSALGSRVLSQLSYIDYLPQVHRHGLDAAFPCPNELLEGIIYINFIRSGAELASNKSLSVSLRVERLLERIMSFSPVEWAWLCSVDAGFHSSRPDNNSNNVTSDPQVNDLVALASAFQEAVLLFCLRTLVLDRDITSSLSNELSKDIHVIRCNASDSLLTHLRQLFPTGALKRKPAMGKFASWPLFIAGMECHYSRSHSIDQERSFVLESLYRISYIQADVSVLDIAPFLQRVWKMETDEFIENTFHDAGVSWDTRIAMLGNHSPFIFK